MKDDYRRTATTVSMIRYHFVFCPRYRRKIYNHPGVETRFKELVEQICQQNDIEVLAMECHIDHCHLFLSAPPKMSPADIMRIIKTNTSTMLRKEFCDYITTKQLWTRSYFVSTAGDVSSETIQHYIATQKTRS